MTRIKRPAMPKFKARTKPYAEVKDYFDSVKPWQSKYNPDNERPIGNRACKLTCDGDRWSRGYGGGYRETAEDRARDREGARFNKAMREDDDGSIVFRLYEHDCVTYHPDNSITIHGYPTVSTNDFINALTPMGISHTCRGKGRDNAYEPVLHLCVVGRCSSPTWNYETHDFTGPERHWIGPYWGSGIVIQCERPVRLYYNVGRRHWMPRDVDALETFETYRIDRKRCREVAREYHLAKIEKVANAAAALTPKPQKFADYDMSDIAEALREERFKDAVDMMPRGEVQGWGRQTFGTPGGVQPGFLRRLRDFIYDDEGAIERVHKPILTVGEYEAYKIDQKRFDA